jgi:DNA-directed RNA polymerase specialized sigma24 family protein
VFAYLTRNPGARAGEIAAGLGVGQGAISAHLYRGKGQLFACRKARWYPIPPSPG